MFNLEVDSEVRFRVIALCTERTGSFCDHYFHSYLSPCVVLIVWIITHFEQSRSKEDDQTP